MRSLSYHCDHDDGTYEVDAVQTATITEQRARVCGRYAAKNSALPPNWGTHRVAPRMKG
jgi:hypothetical protein